MPMVWTGSRFLRSDSPHLPRVSTLGAWERAQQLTDNRLRAMRFYLESEHPKAEQRIAEMRVDLVGKLKELELELSNEYPYSGSEQRKRLAELIRMADAFGREQYPRFELLYAIMGVAVPVSVRGTNYRPWRERWDVTDYDMSVARDMARRLPPWM